MSEPAVTPGSGLLELGADDWALVLGHVRRILNDLDDKDVDAAIKRLRSAPASRLSGGRMRQDLVALLTTRTELWDQVRARLEADTAAAHLAWLLNGGAPPTGGARDPAKQTTQRQRRADDGGDDRRAARAQARLREAREERDGLRRQLEGAEARAARAEARVEELQQLVADLESQVGGLEQEVADERDRTATAVEREQRRTAGRIAELERELTAARRELDTVQQSRRAAQRSRAAAADRRRRGAEPAPVHASGAVVPGRPSRLPAGLRLDTTEGARELLRSAQRVLVDGWNVTKSNWEQLPFDQHRRRLRTALEAMAARFGTDVTVVWDGQGDGDRARARGVLEVFTPDGVTADDELVRLVAELGERDPVVVVTDDAELRERLAEHQPDLLHTRPFLWAIR
ncbi:MAG: NYN domain-containing protein [Nitriliruptorales bacterium]|nr:NYN domain-containing protein [Nitriliruptorales bacterium]